MAPLKWPFAALSQVRFVSGWACSTVLRSTMAKADVDPGGAGDERLDHLGPKQGVVGGGDQDGIRRRLGAGEPADAGRDSVSGLGRSRSGAPRAIQSSSPASSASASWARTTIRPIDGEASRVRATRPSIGSPPARISAFAATPCDAAKPFSPGRRPASTIAVHSPMVASPSQLGPLGSHRKLSRGAR